MTTIGKKVFKGCTGLKEIDCKAVTPPDAEDDTFEEVETSKVKLVVPEGSETKYKAHPVWSQFWMSLRGDVNLDGTVDIADAVCVLNAMAGQPVAGDANVNGDYDANGNPVIDIADLVTVLNIMAGQ